MYRLSMNGSFNYGKLVEDGNHQNWTLGNEKQLERLHQQQIQEKYGYRLKNRSEKRHRSMITNSMSSFTIDKINETLNRKQWRNTCPDFREEVSCIGRAIDASSDIVSDQMHSVQSFDRMYKVKEKNQNTEEHRDIIIERFSRIPNHIEEKVDEKQERQEIITPGYMNQLASANSLILLHNVAKLVTEEPIVTRENDYITDQVEEGKNENSSGRSGEEFIKVVDFCEEEAERNKKQLYPLLPSTQHHKRSRKKSGRKSKTSRLM